MPPKTEETQMSMIRPPTTGVRHHCKPLTHTLFRTRNNSHKLARHHSALSGLTGTLRLRVAGHSCPRARESWSTLPLRNGFGALRFSFWVVAGLGSSGLFYGHCYTVSSPSGKAVVQHNFAGDEAWALASCIGTALAHPAPESGGSSDTRPRGRSLGGGLSRNLSGRGPPQGVLSRTLAPKIQKNYEKIQNYGKNTKKNTKKIQNGGRGGRSLFGFSGRGGPRSFVSWGLPGGGGSWWTLPRGSGVTSPILTGSSVREQYLEWDLWLFSWDWGLWTRGCHRFSGGFRATPSHPM